MILQLIDKETGVHVYSSNEQGSSWAMEVENHLRVFPIMIENINLSGQMLIEVWSTIHFDVLMVSMHASSFV